MKVTQKKECHFDPITITLETQGEAETFFNLINYSPPTYPIDIYGYITQEELRTTRHEMYIKFKKIFDPSCYKDCGDC